MFSKVIWMDLRALHRQGWSIAALAREFNLNRRTVARYVDAPEAPSYASRNCPADLEIWKRAQIESIVSPVRSASSKTFLRSSAMVITRRATAHLLSRTGVRWRLVQAASWI